MQWEVRGGGCRGPRGHRSQRLRGHGDGSPGRTMCARKARQRGRRIREHSDDLRHGGRCEGARAETCLRTLGSVQHNAQIRQFRRGPSTRRPHSTGAAIAWTKFWRRSSQRLCKLPPPWHPCPGTHTKSLTHSLTHSPTHSLTRPPGPGPLKGPLGLALLRRVEDRFRGIHFWEEQLHRR